VSSRSSSILGLGRRRTFTRENLHELTVHHKDTINDNNRPTAATGRISPLLSRQ
jgi:hypothetical protein